jgi:hypothetical protein
MEEFLPRTDVSLLMRTWCFILVLLLAPSAFGDIVQDIGKGSGELYGGGQTFTATANEPQVTTVSYMTGLADTHVFKYPDPTITVNLRSGIGFEGPILGTKTVGPIAINTALHVDRLHLRNSYQTCRGRTIYD